VMASAWAAYMGHAHLRREGVDPDAWYEAAADPRAVSRVSALLHRSGVWSGDLHPVLHSCDEDLLDCMSADNGLFVAGVDAKMDRLSSADCYDAAITDTDIDAFSAELARVWPDEDWVAAAEAGKAARTGGGFTVDGLAVIEAIESELLARMVCPELELYEWYSLPCP
jgi:hypothetical protein